MLNNLHLFININLALFNELSTRLAFGLKIYFKKGEAEKLIYCVWCPNTVHIAFCERVMSHCFLKDLLS